MNASFSLTILSVGLMIKALVARHSRDENLLFVEGKTNHSGGTRIFIPTDASRLAVFTSEQIKY
jgi:hypothetical protein